MDTLFSMETFFRYVKVEYFGIITFLVPLFKKMSISDKNIKKILGSTDKFLMPMFKKYAFKIFINAIK